MNDQQRAAMQMALEALEVSTDWDVGARGKQLQSMKAITALREALAEQADQIDLIETNKALAKEIIEMKKQAEQVPMAWVAEDICDGQFINGRKRRIWWECIEGAGTPLYAAPVRTKDLTDDEAQKLWNDTSSIVPMWAHHLHFARAVIAADREKNK